MKKSKKLYFLRSFMIAAMLLSTTLAMYTNKTNTHLKSKTREVAPLVGFKAPSFALIDMADSKTYRFSSEMDKPVIINFWASWCPPCRNEAPDFAKFYHHYHNDINVFAVNLTHSDQIKDVKDFAKKYHFSFPVLLDSDGKVSRAYWVKTVPTTLLISKEGIIIDRHIGYISSNELNKYVKKLGLGE